MEAPGVSKIVMLLTDGENVVYGASKETTDSDYTSYGYLAGSPYGAPVGWDRTTRRLRPAMSTAGPKASARS